MATPNNISAFSFKHMFAIAGLISTAAAIIALTIFYRDMIVNDIVVQGERQNQLLAQTELNSVKHELVSFLRSVNDPENTSPQKYAIPPKLEEVIQQTLANVYVERIRIYSIDGRIVYTSSGDHDVVDHDNSGFISAISGKVKSKLEYRDIFNLGQEETDITNLVESYLPVREREDSPILGVFEIYTDVNSLVKEIQHTEIIVILGVILILMLLYGLLLTIVRRAANTIEQQQSVIRERTHTLELLSSQLINAEEDEKREIARDLHENIAQTLASVKSVIETALTKQPDQQKNGNSELRQSIKMLQDSIGEIRTLAMELRPPALDDFGLVKTLDWLCRQFQSLYPNLEIETDFELDESTLSDERKTIIYRVAQDTLESIVKKEIADTIKIKLARNGRTITLKIEDNSVIPDSLSANSNPSETASIPLYTMQKRTMLSGGVFTFEKKANGPGAVASSSWLIA